MRCYDCHVEIEDDAEVCPECGMFILDEPESPVYSPGIFAATSVLLGGISLAVLAPIVWERLHVFIPFVLLPPLIGYGLGRKGRFSEWKKTAAVGTAMNLLAVTIFLIYMIWRGGRGESLLWLGPF